MQAGPRTLQALLSGLDQYIIPLFQRYYAWHRKDWQRLWDDLLSLLTPDAPKEHFMGALVCMPTKHEPGKSPQYLVIDGQQRLTTLYILLCALRDEVRRLDATEIAGPIEDYYLVHRYGKSTDRYKLLPRLRDRHTLFALVDGRKLPSTESRIAEAYDFFTKRLALFAASGPATAGEALQQIYAATISKLSLVMITLEEENAFQIFETLNSTGQPLDQADLIRNHVFMHMPLTEQDSFDEGAWRPFEDSLTLATPQPVRLRDFYRDYLMQEGTYVRPDGVYTAFRTHLAETGQSPAQLVEVLRGHATHYLWLHQPALAPDPVRLELDRLRRLRVSTAYPLILHLLGLHASAVLSLDALAQALRLIQSFVIRRSITRESTRGYGVLFPAVIRELNGDDILGSLTAALARRGWPGDQRFLSHLVTFPLYRREPDIARVAFIALEQMAAHKEAVDVGALLDKNELQLEHVLPQVIGQDAHGQAWQQALGPDWRDLHDTWLHTLGNLTLTGYNPSLSNHAFETKRQAFQKSHLELNRYFQDLPRWDAAAIQQRGETLAPRLAQFWPAPAAVSATPSIGVGHSPGGHPVSPIPEDQLRPNSWRRYPNVPWTQEDIRRLRDEVRNPTVRATLDLTSQRPNEWIPLREVESAAGRSTRQARSDLAGLTMFLKSRYGRHNWPFQAAWAAGGEPQVYYRALSPDHARWWRDSH
jgi:hypothetical protein